MESTSYSFMDIFEKKIDIGTEKVFLNKISIPLIQRDYAQGRRNLDIKRIRERFLSSLKNAVTGAPITLDFIYGDIDEKGTMTPLDGQQRLTTLFLLHWYAAKKEKVSEEDYDFLNRFSYEGRYSTQYFCSQLVKFNPSFNKELYNTLSKEIIDQPWFLLDWRKVPTIDSMLVMLDDIDEKFKYVEVNNKRVNIWEKLSQHFITFYFLPIKDMGLIDELYIKMNSRGKPLTLFEQFKAELEREIRFLDEQLATKIITKIDRTWTDLLWNYRNTDCENSDDNIIDDKFLRYFQFICDIICYKKGQSPQGNSRDVFDLLQKYFSASKPDTPTNLATLESFFDCWCNILNPFSNHLHDYFPNPSAFLESFMSKQHERGKIKVYSRYKIDIFNDCLYSYSDKTGRIRKFPLNRIILLYAITVYLQHQVDVEWENFVRRIRIVNNLIQNSEDEISDRLDQNRIPAILAEVDAIILTGAINDTIENNFNVNQLQEEKGKIAYIGDLKEALFTLEDHPMLKGQISIIGIENIKYAKRFASLFCCDWDKIDCALMATGNYGQLERNKWRYQFASKNLQIAWDKLFHKSANAGFENTKSILIKLLSTNETFTNDILESITTAFIKKCEADSTYPWEYYYVKYPEFRPGSYGKFSKLKAKTENQPYLLSVMQTKYKWSLNTYVPYLKAVENINKDAHLSKDGMDGLDEMDEMGQHLVCGDLYISCDNAAYTIVHANGKEKTRVFISQNDKGIDTEDRIIKLNKYLTKNKSPIEETTNLPAEETNKLPAEETTNLLSENKYEQMS